MLKINLETLDGVDDAFHSLYTEQTDGTFKLTGVEGMKSQEDIDRLQTALTKERTDHRSLKTAYAPIVASGMKVDEVVNLIDRREELEAAAAAGGDRTKIDSIVEGRLKSRLGPVERERDSLKTQLAERDTELANFKTERTERTIGDAIKSAATKTPGFHPHAVEDALMMGLRNFSVDEDGRVVTKDGMEPSAWLVGLRDSRPHWWQGNQGGGAGGGQGKGSYGNNPFTAENWNLTEQGKLVVADRAKAEQLAKQAGTTIGGRQPAAKK